jgi:hypothetical protein
MENRPRRHIHIFWPLLLIALGVFLFLNNLQAVKSGTTLETLIKLWPLLLIVGGIEAFINHHGFLWPIVLTGLGVIFLLSNFGVIQMPVWTAIVRLWPVLLIALGLNLVIGRAKGWWSPVLGIVLGLLLIAGIVFMAVHQPGAAGKSVSIDFPSAQVQTVSGSIEMTAGKMILSTQSGSTSLLKGQVQLSENEQLDQSFVSKSDATYSLRSHGGNYMYVNDSGNYTWNLMLDESLPTNLNLKSAAGTIEADLSKANLTQLNVNLAAGKILLAIPQTGTYHAYVEDVVGEIVICVPDNLAIKINLDTAVSATNFETGLTRNGSAPNGTTATAELDVKNPVGVVSFRHLKNCQFSK